MSILKRILGRVKGSLSNVGTIQIAKTQPKTALSFTHLRTASTSLLVRTGTNAYTCTLRLSASLVFNAPAKTALTSTPKAVKLPSLTGTWRVVWAKWTTKRWCKLWCLWWVAIWNREHSIRNHLFRKSRRLKMGRPLYLTKNKNEIFTYKCMFQLYGGLNLQNWKNKLRLKMLQLKINKFNNFFFSYL